MNRLADDPSVVSFRAAAQQYCDLIRAHAAVPVGQFLGDVEASLVALYGAALRLPKVMPVSDRPLPQATTIEDRMALFQSLNAYLGVHGRYHEIYDPVDPDKQAVVAPPLADDLVDILGDVQDGLDAWPGLEGQHMEDIVWDWHSGFADHWGQHLVDALRPIHWMLHVHAEFTG